MHSSRSGSISPGRVYIRQANRDQGGLPQAAQSNRGPGTRPFPHGRRGPLLHRHRHADLRRSRRVAARRGGGATGPRRALCRARGGLRQQGRPAAENRGADGCHRPRRTLRPPRYAVVSSRPWISGGSIAVGNNAAPYAKDAADKIPVVAIHVSDPIGMGLVKSLARPGGNITGVSNQSTEMVGKRLQLLKEMAPGLSRIAVSVNPDARISPFHITQTRDAAANLGLDTQTFEWRSLVQLEQAFDAMVSASMQALVTNPDGLAFTYRGEIAKLAIRRHLPLATWSR